MNNTLSTPKPLVNKIKCFFGYHTGEWGVDTVGAKARFCNRCGTLEVGVDETWKNSKTKLKEWRDK